MSAAALLSANCVFSPETLLVINVIVHALIEAIIARACLPLRKHPLSQSPRQQWSSSALSLCVSRFSATSVAYFMKLNGSKSALTEVQWYLPGISVSLGLCLQ